MILKVSITLTFLLPGDPSSNKSVITMSCETYHGYFCLLLCDLSFGPTSFFGSDFLCQSCTSVPFFQSAFQMKTDVKIHVAAAAQHWESNVGLVLTRRVFYHDSQ